MNWNIAEALYRLGESPIADRPALIHGDTIVSFAELKRRSSGIAAWLDTLGLPAGAHVGHYLRNSNCYLETFTGVGLAGMSHVNVNYRYLEQELVDLCNGLDIRVLVYDQEFASRVAAIRERLTETVAFVEVPADAPVEDFATDIQALYEQDSSGFQRRTSGDDLVLVATGGTTGLPKGVQWRHEDLWHKLNMSTGMALAALNLDTPPGNMDDHVANVQLLAATQPFLPLSPLMHGAALMMAVAMLGQGIPLLTVPGERFDADCALDLIKRHQASGLALVGDAFASPLVEALDRRKDDTLLQSVIMLISTGASLSDRLKTGLMRHKADLILIDTLGSSEASGIAMSTPEAGVFQPLPSTRVLDENLQDVVPGSDTIGIAYSGGYAPIGYYNEPEKSAEVFVEIDGTRLVMTGDRCRVREDGMLLFLGRDSTVINTGGEKVYTVEVERVLVDHPAVADALVVGLPHPRFGNMVVAVVEGQGSDQAGLDAESIRSHAREHLADYKVPRHVFAIDSLQRAPNGKPDYPLIREYAAGALARAQQASTNQ